MQQFNTNFVDCITEILNILSNVFYYITYLNTTTIFIFS